jgi:hypothetical protein
MARDAVYVRARHVSACTIASNEPSVRFLWVGRYAALVGGRVREGFRLLMDSVSNRNDSDSGITPSTLAGRSKISHAILWHKKIFAQ